MKKPAAALCSPSRFGDSIPGWRTKEKRYGWRMIKKRLLSDSDWQHQETFHQIGLGKVSINALKIVHGNLVKVRDNRNRGADTIVDAKVSAVSIEGVMARQSPKPYSIFGFRLKVIHILSHELLIVH